MSFCKEIYLLNGFDKIHSSKKHVSKPIISKLNNNVFLEETLKPDLNEIEKIFIADAEELLSPINHYRIKAPENSLMNMTWKVKYKNENIWGLTARLLVTLSAGFNLRGYPPCNDI